MSGKGSAPRPYSVPKETFDQSFDMIFGAKRKPIKTQEEFTEWLKAAVKENGDENRQDNARKD